MSGSDWRRTLGAAVAWAVLWTGFWAIVGGVIGVVDPDSIDPGEGWMFLVVFGPMGLLTGGVLCVLLARTERGRAWTELALLRAVGWGILATAAVQMLYLGHGDQGLAANAGMALLFCAVGGLVSAVWLAALRAWSRRRGVG
jgi:hypothetical protein